VLARERSDYGFSGESRGGHARGERLPQAGLRGSHRRWATRHSLSGRKQGATARHCDHADTRTLLLHRVAGAPLEQIHSGRIRLLLPSNAVVFTGTSGRIVGDLYKGKRTQLGSQIAVRRIPTPGVYEIRF